MYLKRCEISNFRSIRELKIGFENNFQILVGLNEAGKSNILKALSFLDSKVMPDGDDIRDPRHDESPVDTAYIRFVFGLEKKETKQIFEKIKHKFKSKTLKFPIIKIGSKVCTLQEFCDYKKEGLYVIDILKKNKSARHWTLNGSQYTISKAWKKVPKDWDGYAKFEEDGFDYLCVEDFPEFKEDSGLEEISLESLNNVVGGELNNFVKANIFDCIVWRYSENNLLPGRIDVATFSANPDSCEPLRNIFYLAGYFDIPKAISGAESKTNGMRNLLRKLSDNTTKHLGKVWPEYSTLSIDLTLNGSVIEAVIQDEFNVYSLDRRSDGFKRFVTFLMMISVKAKADCLSDALIIIDEPDIGLHPSGIQFLREELKKISKDNIVVIATHSIFMIDKDRIDRHLIVKKEKEETKIISDYASKMLDEEVIYKALGYSLFDLLKKRNVIFEGWNDKYAFQCWLSSTSVITKVKNSWKNIGMIHAFGAKDVQRVAAHLENFDREYLVLSDADKPALDWQKKFEGKYQWVTYKDLGFKDKETIEDFLDDTYVLDRVFGVLKKEQLDAGVSFEGCLTFNSKMEKLKQTIGAGKEEMDRLKRLIKNSIFNNIPPKRIGLTKLVDVIDIASDSRFHANV